MTIGIYGLIFELANPGFTVPGVVGVISLLLALYALQLLPVNYAGLGLIFFGIACMIAEAFLPSFGVLGLGGVIAFVFGALVLIDTESPGYGIPLALIAAVAILSALLIAAVVGMALKTRRRAVAGDDLIGSMAEVVEETGDRSRGEGWARVRGEIWRVVSNSPLHRAQKVRVVSRRGLVLRVIPFGALDEGDRPC